MPCPVEPQLLTHPEPELLHVQKTSYCLSLSPQPPPGHWEVKAAKEFAKFDLALGVAVVTLALIFVSGYFASIVESLLIQVFNGTFLIAAIPVGVMMFVGEGPLMVAPSPRMRWCFHVLTALAIAACAYLLAVVSAILALAMSLT